MVIGVKSLHIWMKCGSLSKSVRIVEMHWRSNAIGINLLSGNVFLTHCYYLLHFLNIKADTELLINDWLI